MRRFALALLVSLHVALSPQPAASAPTDFLVETIGRCLAIFNLAGLAIEQLQSGEGEKPGDADTAKNIMKRSYDRLTERAGQLPEALFPTMLNAFTVASEEMKFVVTEDLTRDFLTLANQCNVAFGLLEPQQIIPTTP